MNGASDTFVPASNFSHPRVWPSLSGNIAIMPVNGQRPLGTFASRARTTSLPLRSLPISLHFGQLADTLVADLKNQLLHPSPSPL